MYRCIDQERDYQNNPKAFARDVLRFEIALEGAKFLKRLEYAPRDAALTDASVPTPIAAVTLVRRSDELCKVEQRCKLQRCNIEGAISQVSQYFG